MIGGLPAQTGAGIAEHALRSLGLIAGSIALAAFLAWWLWYTARRARQPWGRVMRVGAIVLGSCVVVAVVGFVFLLISL